MHSTTALLMVPATAVAALVATAAPAAAAPAAFATVYTLAQGPCVGQVEMSVNGNAYPNQAAFTVGATLVGAGPCTLPLTLNWRNVATGQEGAFKVVAQGPGYWGNSGHSALFVPGIGTFTATVGVGAAHFPAPGTVEFTVPQYQG
ncbi:hypothetical protein IU486_27265 [Streptomyces gardneri]|uniref:hypothetical protein n=1 Tax=Nocardia TaxID=1817 RepID=UPI001357E137|nr:MULTISPECIES: hypothetical protein [Nocardia]MBF6168423.1 hypothetical protein [Streptomyces gardneri]MBF6205917.1 hypothetical protein [Streptomyces gardneri]UAK32254.1 hypothetical protein K8O92_31940 [Nocardia asteroides]